MPAPTFAVPITGVGRADYSDGVEFSVEPTIRSYQQVYSEWRTVTVPAGADLVVNIPIPTGYVAMVYDFFATVRDLILLRMLVQSVSGVVIADVITQQRYGSLAAKLPKGYPFFANVRFTIHNYGIVARDVNVGAVGIYTDVSHYAQVWVPPGSPLP